MADFANFLQNMQDNQSKFQEQIVHLLQNNFPDPSVPQQQHNPVHSRYTAVSADSAANMQVQGNFPVQSAEPGTLMIQACPHTSNTTLRTPEATPSLLAAPGILSPSNGIFFSQIDSFPVHTGPTCSDQFWTCPQVSYTSLVLPTPVTPLPSAPSNFPLPKTPFLGHFSCNNSSFADLGNNGGLIQALQPQCCPQASSCSEGKLVGVSTTESAFSAEIKPFFNSSTEQQSVQANSMVQSSPQSINISQRISEQVPTSPVGQNNFSHIETSSSATISGFSANSDHEMARQLHQQQKGDFYLPSNSSLGMVTQLSENNPFVVSPKTCILGDNNNFSFPLLHHTQESPAVLDPHFINGNNTTCGIPEAQIQYLSPIVFSQQNSLLPNSTNALTALQVNLPKVKNNRAAKQPHAPKNQQAATDPVHIIGNSAANLPIASNALHAPIPQHITPLIVTEQASPPAHQCHDMKPFEPHNIQLSSASLHSSSKETVVPCSFSPKKNKTDFKSKNHSTSFYKQNTPTPSINRSLSISNNTFKNKIRFQNQFDPISDLHWEDDGEGENWNCLGSSEDDDNSSMGGYSPVGPTHFRDVPKLNVHEALNWSSMAEEEPLKSMEALADDQFAAALNHHNQNAGSCCMFWLLALSFDGQLFRPCF
ncbi:hypothetical protein LguiB_012358 [Lonicera macranthoides]